jgi:hypothetical protein
LGLGGPSSYCADAFDARSLCVNVRVIACRMGALAYRGSAVVVEVPVCIGNGSPEVVNAKNMVVGGFENDWGDGVGDRVSTQKSHFSNCLWANSD